MGRTHLAAMAAALLLPALAQAQQAPQTNDWPNYGRDAGGQRFSPLTQITPANVGTLDVAWSVDLGTTGAGATPLVIHGVMYVPAGQHVFALEPETGREIWKYDAKAAVTRRGVAYWPGDKTTAPRIYSSAGNGKMIALDAKTGTLATGFGDAGIVDIKQSVKGDVDGRFSLMSPPVVHKNILITGGNNNEPQPSLGLYGDVRGWDAKSGKLLWSFHTVPRAGEPGVETWEGESWKNRSGTNVWGFMTVDVARGLVFLPIGSPTSDFYGADRKGDNLYGDAIVALDAATGKLKWFHQLVHHDLWDYDLSGAPALIDVTRPDRGGVRKTVPAIAVITKMATLFIFNRVTGEPLFGLEERPVPQSTVPGEQTSATQPFPLRPAPLARVDFDPAKDFYTATPDHAAFCKELWEKNQIYTKGPFTPPGLEGTMLTFPSTLGGGNWNGVSYDPSRGLVFTNTMSLGQLGRMELRADPKTGEPTYVRTSPFGGPYGRFWNPQTTLPCQAPPYGELVAVNVNTGDIAWRTPLGVIDELEAQGVKNTGALNLGGSIATASGLIFVGATSDGRFRAFESKSGKELWVRKLEASAYATPMTFMGKDGRQYVAIAAGGGGFFQTKAGRQLTVFALPASGSRPPQ
jgi:quinoprotein glucose dehydrogenase